jgi:hypothetical protein
MQAIQDFEDMLSLLNKHEVKYLVVGGLAFIYHAKPKYTKDIDIWIDAAEDNVFKVNRALEEFGSPSFLTPNHPEEILQIGIEPDRIDLIQNLEGVAFSSAWNNRITDRYGDTSAFWICIDDLIRLKSRIDQPRHQEDARILREVKKLRQKAE